MEMLAMAVPEIKVLITGKWQDYDEAPVISPGSKKNCRDAGMKQLKR